MLLAAVDLGSNSFRLEIGQVEGSLIGRHGYWKETVRLAAGLGADLRLSGRAIEAACACLARMNERMRGLPTEQVRAVGTQTLRQALNSNEFLLEAQSALGYPIEIIAGREEARLVFEGCMHSLPPSPRRRLVIDIGGASSEVIVGRDFTAERAESFNVGCVNTTMRYFADGAIDRGSFKRALVGCAAAFEEAISDFNTTQWDEAFGSSGTIGAVSAILRAQGWSDGTVTALGLLKLRQALIDAGDVKRVRFDGIKPDRAEVLAGGVAVLCAAFETFGLHQLQTAKGALRVGVLYDLLGRREHRDIRDATVDRILERFGVDRAQSERVARVALDFHAAIDPGASDERRKSLRWAAQLHEVGGAISHNDYHKHSSYLIAHADLAGFSTSDQERVAQLALGQRGNLRKMAQALADPEQAAKILALRLAVVACHARRPMQLPRWTLRYARAVELGLDADWLEAHPLTRHLLDEEAQHWDRVGVRFALKAL
ncbi:MAG TPA: Ppx/GppA phosphatase family protein [Burkholderiaceae bacterium]|nr:Ppx/GppA phosphatase family protein [Burkholderiaceae bacterium]